MFLFNKKNKPPVFETLNASPHKEKYIKRLCQWRWLGKGQIVVTDNNQPRLITLDPWPQLVFLEARGDKTIFQLVYYFASQYTSKVPEELDKTVLHEVETLLREGLIELNDYTSGLLKLY